MSRLRAASLEAGTAGRHHAEVAVRAGDGGRYHPVRLPRVRQRAGTAARPAGAARTAPKLTIGGLIAIVGERRALQLIRRFAAQRIPNPRPYERERRNVRLRALLDAGATYGEAARRCGVQRRWAIRIGKKENDHAAR